MFMTNKQKIIYAINTANCPMLMKLIKNTEDANMSSDVDGKTPTIVASKYNNIKLLKYLLTFQINLNASTYVKINHIMDNFQNEFNFINSYDESALWWASRYGNANAVQLLCESKANVNLSKRGSSPLMEASKNGNLDIIKILIKYGADINYCSFDKPDFDYTYPLKEAVRYKYKNIISFLLEHNAMLINNKCTKTPFEISATRKYNGIFKMLVEQVKKENKFYAFKPLLSKCLIMATRSSQITIIEYLISLDINIDVVDIEGDSALIEASRNNNAKIVEILLNRGCDKSIKNNKGLTALDMAVQHKCDGVIGLLI